MPVICEYTSHICDHIYYQNLHIAYFLAHNGIFKNAEIMLHMQNLHILAYMVHISAYAITFFSIFLVQRSVKIGKYFLEQTDRYLQ